MKLFLKLIILSAFLFSCSTRTCKPNQSAQTNDKLSTVAVAGETKVAPITVMTNQIKKIRIYKADGSVQCEPGTGLKPEQMQKQLGELKVYSAANQHDGLLRIQVCGQPTGHCNVYEINESDFAQAEKLGFKKWKNK